MYLTYPLKNVDIRIMPFAVIVTTFDLWRPIKKFFPLLFILRRW
jgi:hypothetical protein